MSNLIKLKRGSGSDPQASDLVVGEVALRTDSGQLFTKKDSGDIQEIGAASGVSVGDKGDIVVSNGGETFTIDSGVVNNAKIASNAAIAGSKISPDFGSQDISARNLTLTDNNPTITWTDTDNNPDFRIEVNGGNFTLHDITNGVNKFEITPTGNIEFVGNVDFLSGGIDVTGNITGTGNLTGVKSIQTTGHDAITGTPHTYKYGRGSQAGGLSVYANESAIEVVGTDGSNHAASFLLRTTVDGAGFIYNPTDNALELKLFTTSANDFTLHSSGANVSDIDTQIRVVKNSKVELAHSGTVKFQTTSLGARIDTILTLYGAAGNPGRLRLQEGGALSEIRGVRNSDNNSLLYFDTEIAGSTATRLIIDENGHLKPSADSTYNLGTSGNRWANVFADALNIAGAITSTGNVTTNGDLTIQNANPILYFNDTGANPDYHIKNNNGYFDIVDGTATATRLSINNTGELTVAGNANFGNGVDVTGSITSTGSLTITSAAPAINLTESDADPDFQIKVSGGDFKIKAAGSGKIIINDDGHIDLVDHVDISSGLDVTKTTSSGQDPILKALHSNLSQGVALGYNTISAIGSNTNVDLRLESKGSGEIYLIDNVNAQAGIDCTGNIVVSGSVDGRDVAGDGVYLDSLYGGSNGAISGNVSLNNGVTATTQSAGDNTTKVATTAFVSTAVSNIVDSAPSALNTLNELAAALGDDANFSTTVTNSIGTKMPLAGGQFTGNITFSGSQTVDGRDLSVDGAKLDGIESNATADQTASEILTLIKTVDGTGSGLDADTLDGISSASFVRSDAADTCSGKITFSDGIVLPTTGDGIKFGAGDAINDDAHIEWLGGSNAGYLRISTSDDSDDSSSSEYIEFGDYAVQNKVGAFTQHVKISRENFLVRTGSHTITQADRLNIASDGTVDIYGNLDVGAGIDVTGDITATGDLYINSTRPKITLNDTDNESDFEIKNENGSFRIRDMDNPTDRYKINTSGTIHEFLGSAGFSSTLNVVSNITVGGTVDGRDVAADGTKLDGIETGATADQTASEIKTLLNSSGLVNAQIDASAAIAGSKIDPDFGSQAVTAGHSSFGNITALGLNITNTNATINFNDTNNNPDYRVKADSGVFDLDQFNNGGSDINVFKVNTDGHIDVGTNVDFGAGIDVTGNIVATGNITADGNVRIQNASPILYFTDTGNNPDYQIKNNNGYFDIFDETNTATRLSISNSGELSVAGNANFGAGIDVTGDIVATGNLNAKDIVLTDTAPLITFNDSDHENDFVIGNLNGTFIIQDADVPVNRFTVATGGQTTISGNLDCGAGIDVTGNITATGEATISGQQLTVQGTSPRIRLVDTDQDSDFQVSVDAGSFKIEDITNSADRFVIDSTGNTALGDTSSTPIGTAATLRVANSGSSAGYSVFEAASSVGSIRLANDGAFNVTGAATFSSGISTSAKDVHTGGGAIINGDSDGAFSDRSGSNIDHIWYQEDNSQANRGWNFCEDTTYKAVGQGQINVGRIRANNQPAVLVTNVTNETYTDSDNDDPIRFATTDTNNGGCTINSSRSRITVPIAGVYLLLGCISGTAKSPVNAGDGINLVFRKNGSSAHPRTDALPFQSFGDSNGEEWSFTANIVTNLAAGDYIEIALRNIGQSVEASIERGYLGVVMLH